MKWLNKLYGYVCFAEEVIAGLFLVAVMVLIFGSGVARSLGHPLRWGMDMATFLFAWTAFFSADVALRKDRHIRVEALVKHFPPKVQHYIGLLNYGVILTFLVFLMVYGVILAYGSRFRTFQGIPGFSYMWVTLSVPLGSLLLLISSIRKGKELLNLLGSGVSDES
jgi:TRAP-type C4-dicarboxylate transport system permease small subunit